MNHRRLDNSKIASMIFGQPLMIDPKKLDVILKVLEPRFGIIESTDSGILGGYVESGLPETSKIKLSHGENKENRRFAVSDGIAFIQIAGTLVHKSGGLDALSGLTSYQQLQTEIMDAATSPDIDGILFDIDSPGGTVNGAFDLADLIFEVRSMKPVWAMIDEMAFSAAYCLGSSAHKIFAPRTGQVGSIGVIAMHFDQSVFNEKVGIKVTPIIAGKNKNDFSPHSPLSNEAREAAQKQVDFVYDLFVQTVSRNRVISESSVIDTQAATFNSEDSLKNKLIDGIETRDEVIKLFKKEIFFIKNNTSISLTKEIVEMKKETKDEKKDEIVVPEKEEAKASSTAEEKIIHLETKNKAYAENEKLTEQVSELCQIAGREDLLPGFIAAKTSLADVRVKLLEEKAKGNNQEISERISNKVFTNDTGVDVSNPNNLSLSQAMRVEQVQNSPLVLAAKKQGEKMREQYHLIN